MCESGIAQFVVGGGQLDRTEVFSGTAGTPFRRLAHSAKPEHGGPIVLPLLSSGLAREPRADRPGPSRQ
jgi:hypothetical protein